MLEMELEKKKIGRDGGKWRKERRRFRIG